MKISVVIADEHQCVRQMLSMILENEGNYEVLANVGTGPEALRACRSVKPRLLILDLVLPQMGGLELLRQVRAEAKETRLFIFSRSNNRELTVAALEARPHGFVRKSDSLDTLREALRAVTAGFVFLTPYATNLLDEDVNLPADRSALSARESTVMQMIAEGMSTKEIAARLSVAEKTVDHNRTELMRKLKVHNIAALTRMAIRRGVITLD